MEMSSSEWQFVDRYRFGQLRCGSLAEQQTVVPSLTVRRLISTTSMLNPKPNSRISIERALLEEAGPERDLPFRCCVKVSQLERFSFDAWRSDLFPTNRSNFLKPLRLSPSSLSRTCACSKRSRSATQSCAKR